MTEHSKTVRIKIGKWYAKNMLQIEPGFNVHIAFDKKCPQQNEANMTITCFDDYPYPPYRRTKEDLESYLVRKFGSMILEDRRRARSLELSSASKGIPLTHPIVKQDKKDYPSMAENFKEEYYLPLSRVQLQEANSTLWLNRYEPNRIKADHIKKTSGYESDVYKVRMGKWQ